MRADEWNLDFVLTGSQKALALPPGLAFAVASEAMMARSATVDGKGVISVSDEQGRKLLWLGATVDGEGLIASFDHFGAVKACWP